MYAEDMTLYEKKWGMNEAPSREDLAAVASFSSAFAAPGFTPGEWVAPGEIADGFMFPWYASSEPVSRWHNALYEHHTIDPDSDYLGEANVALVNRVIKDPALVGDMDLPTLRRVLTFVARAERHTGGGWFAEAFKTGMAQAATRRLGELAG